MRWSQFVITSRCVHHEGRFFEVAGCDLKAVCILKTAPRARGAQSSPMLALQTPRRPAPFLACRGVRLRPNVRPNAFGNALGNSIAQGIASSGSQQAATLANNRSALNAVNQVSDADYYAPSYSHWPDQTGAESARLAMYEDMAGGGNLKRAQAFLDTEPMADASSKLTLSDKRRDTSEEASISRRTAFLNTAEELERQNKWIRDRMGSIQGQNPSNASGRGSGSRGSGASALYASGAGDIRATFTPMPSTNYSDYSYAPYEGDLFTWDTPAAVANVGITAPTEGFMAGLTGHERNVLDPTGPASFAENAGLYTRGLATGLINGAWNFGREVVNQYRDAYNMVTTPSVNFRPSSGLFNSYQQNGVGRTMLNGAINLASSPTQPIFDALEGRYSQAGAGTWGMVGAGLGLARLRSGLGLGGATPNTTPWNSFSPNVNWGHVFTGELRYNAQGVPRALGYHHESSFSPNTAQVVPGSRTAVDANGVYRADVLIQDPRTGAWVPKNSMSSFFPRAWTPDRINTEVMAAFEQKVWTNNPATPTAARGWEGITPSGVRVRGFFHNGAIDTVFPIYGGQP